MARPRIQIETVSDFRGGLNLRSNSFLLGDSESPDLLNVDVDPRGGFRLRRGVNTWGDALAGEVSALIPFRTDAGVKQVIAQVGGSLLSGTGGGWTALPTGRSGTLNFTSFKNRLYVQNGSSAPLRWDGTTATSLTQTWNNNLDAPNQGDMPIGKCVATHMGSVWVANTVEGGTAFPNRVRWSHPNHPEDFVDYHYIDIDTGLDGDEITALVPFGDRLIVFKNRSVHAVYGQPPENLQVFPISQEVGAPSQQAVVSTDIGVYFYSGAEGVFLYQGKQPEWQYESLFPATLDGSIHPDDVQLGWGKRRLWVSVRWRGSSTRNRVFVLDPSLSKGGTWVAYDLTVGPFLEWDPTGEEPEFLAALVGGTRVLRLDVDDQVGDDFGNGLELFPSYYCTRWFTAGHPTLKKRFKRPELVMKGGSTATVNVDVYHDYDPSHAARHFTAVTAADGEWGVWGQSTWGGAVWGRASSERNEIERGPSLGTGRAVSLRFRGPTEGVPADWGVDSLTIKYIPKVVRS